MSTHQEPCEPPAWPATAFRGRMARLLEREAGRTPRPRHVVVLAVDGLPYALARQVWSAGVTEPVTAVLPTTSSAGWLSSLTGLSVAEHAVPGVVFRSPEDTGELINVFSYRGPGLTGARENLFADARRLGLLPLAVLGDLEAYPCSWRDALLRHAHPVTGHRFYTRGGGGGGAYRAPDPGTVEAAVRRAVTGALDARGGDRPCLVWCYIELDRHVHHHGYDAHVRQALAGLERVAAELAGKGAVVVAHSDHGLTPTRHDPRLARLLDALGRRHGCTTGGAGRVRWLYPAAAGATDRLVRDLERELPPSVRLFSADALLPPGSAGRARAGEIVLMAEGEEFLTEPAYTHDHGSAREAEVYTPFTRWGAERRS